MLLSGSGGLTSGEVVIASSSTGQNAKSGDISIISGSANEDGAISGTVLIASGNTRDTTSGQVQISGGDSNLGKGADVNVLAGIGTMSGMGGNVSLSESFTNCY